MIRTFPAIQIKQRVFVGLFRGQAVDTGHQRPTARNGYEIAGAGLTGHGSREQVGDGAAPEPVRLDIGGTLGGRDRGHIAEQVRNKTGGGFPVYGLPAGKKGTDFDFHGGVLLDFDLAAGLDPVHHAEHQAGKGASAQNKDEKMKAHDCDLLSVSFRSLDVYSINDNVYNVNR